MKKKQLLKKIVAAAAVSFGILTISGLSASADSVNSYVESHYGPDQHSQLKTQIYPGFPTRGMSFGAGLPNGVVVHETANEHSNINSEISFMEHHYQNAFVHSFVGKDSIVNIANLNDMCWGAGPFANARFMQFEQTRMHSKDSFAAQVNNAAWYTAYLLKSHGLTPSRAVSKNNGTVWSHHDVSRILGGTDHTDPDDYWANRGSRYFGQPYDMNQFVQLVNDKYPYVTADPNSSDNGPQNDTAPAPTKHYTYYWTRAKRFRLYRFRNMTGVKRNYRHKIHVRILKKVMKNGKKRGWHVQLKGSNYKGYLKTGVHLRKG